MGHETERLHGGTARSRLLAGTRDALASGPLLLLSVCSSSGCVRSFSLCVLLLGVCAGAAASFSAACVGVGVVSFKDRVERGGGGNRWVRTGAASAAVTVRMASLRNRLV